MANILDRQYKSKSVFNSPNEERAVQDPQSFFADLTEDSQKLCSIDISERDIIEVIHAIANHVAAGPDGLHALLLKHCKSVLAKPLQML